MFQHPSHTAQFAADRRLARRADATSRRARRSRRVTVAAADHDALAAERAGTTGLDEAGVDVAAIVRLARRRCIGTKLAGIVADPAQPIVARQRALGRLLAVLATADQIVACPAQPAA